MKHFNREECSNYVENLSSEAELELIEEHLISCETCLKQYIEILEEREVIKITNLPHNFVSEVMNKIERSETRINNRLNSKKKILICYVSAACITLFLMGSGTFTMMAKSIPIATAQIIHSPAKIEASLGKLKFNNMNLKFMNLFKTKL
jgi:predicted anti-sigma-YlaC factor YlaD